MNFEHNNKTEIGYGPIEKYYETTTTLLYKISKMFTQSSGKPVN